MVGLEPTTFEVEARHSIQLSYTPMISNLVKTTKADDGTRTHALRLADSDASHYITPALFRADNEARTRIKRVEISYASHCTISALRAGGETRTRIGDLQGRCVAIDTTPAFW